MAKEGSVARLETMVVLETIAVEMVPIPVDHQGKWRQIKTSSSKSRLWNFKISNSVINHS